MIAMYELQSKFFGDTDGVCTRVHGVPELGRDCDGLHAHFETIRIPLNKNAIALQQALTDNLVPETAPEDFDSWVMRVDVKDVRIESADPFQVVVCCVR